MAPKAPKEEASDTETMRAQFISKLSTAADAMRQFGNFADSLAKVVAKVPLDDPELVETLQAVIDATPAPSRKRKLAAADLAADDGGRKKKREKKAKDPNAPKAPPSAYIMFQNEIRNAVREQHPGVQYKELMGLIAKQWNSLSSEKKQPYFDRVTTAKQTHEVDLAKYNASNPDFVPPEPKKAKKAAEPAPKTAKKPAITKVAKAPPKSAEIIASSAEESDDGSGTGSSSDEKPPAKESDVPSDEDEDEEDESDEDEPVLPTKNNSKPNKKR
ncbi:hypothetical protein HYDPIDRAFT_35982 [Hydnomerulius pinastri MD-312]|nr:hypothetical protein HYDPIDRAFT_35982 [Hydnomerulius pinastri MD-312]